MAQRGGSAKYLAINGRHFSIPADNDINLDPGGETTELAMNGDNTARYIVKVEGWSLTGLQIGVDESKDDVQFLKERAADISGEDRIEICLADRNVYAGKGRICSRIVVSTQNATATFDLMGGGSLDKQ